jgi:dTDP-glucose pyrophosphorylase
MENENLQQYFIEKSVDLLSAIKQMDNIGKKLLIVVEEGKFYSMLSIGDIQRAIIKNNNFKERVENILRSSSKQRVADIADAFEDIKNTMLEYRTEFMPVVDENNYVRKIYFWNEIFSSKEKRITRNLNLPVVIMAGGKGKRLKPITNILPKPLIPIGEKSILELIMDKFVQIGSNEFHISLNYKSDMIKYYLNQLANPDYRLSYFEEEKPLGTIGSLYMLKEKINKTFFVSNCDIIIEEDYGEIYDYHVSNKNDLTIVAALKHYPIPYGTLETAKDGVLKSLNEKPELTFKINSGMYILEPHLLKEIPENQFYHITDLIEKIKQKQGKVGVFPVSEKSWKDIGEWNEYISQIKDGH